MNVHEILGRVAGPSNIRTFIIIIIIIIIIIRLDFGNDPDPDQYFHFSIIDRHGVSGIKYEVTELCCGMRMLWHVLAG